jgi:hypothetical protein
VATVHPKTSLDFKILVVVVVVVVEEEVVEVVIVVVMVTEMVNPHHGVITTDRKVVIQMEIEIKEIVTVNQHNHQDVWVGVMSQQLVQIDHHVRH